jgi:NAD+ synthetase
MAGGLAVISDLPKTFVYPVCEEANVRAGREVIPRSVFDKAPSAELRPGQRDEDSLPPYPVLDALLEQIVEQHRSIDEIVELGHDRALVMRIERLVRASEYKRKQMPPGLIVTGKAFGSGRRYPIAQSAIGY